MSVEQLGAHSERYFSEDPIVALITPRQFGEALAQTELGRLRAERDAALSAAERAKAAVADAEAARVAAEMGARGAAERRSVGKDDPLANYQIRGVAFRSRRRRSFVDYALHSRREICVRASALRHGL
jgi:hypothetical protein